MEHQAATTSGHLYVSTDIVTLLGRNVCTELHRHFSGSVSIALGPPFRARISSQEPWQSLYGMAARSNALQQLDGSGTLVLNLQVDPETEAYARLHERLFTQRETVFFDQAELAPLLSQVQQLLAAPGTTQAGQPLWEAVLERLGAPARGPRRFDVRITRVLETLKAAMPEAPSTRELGEAVGLSEGRLIHLFSEQVGVPLRRYILWLRIRHIVFCLATGQNLTDAAHEAGFSDSAHLTRVFRSMFGIAPSQILRSDGVGISLELPRLPLTGPHAVQDRARMQRMLKSLTAIPLK